MKTAAKVFIILGMIIGSPAIIPIIIGALSLKKLKTETDASNLTGPAIATILLCSLLGGIFMLLLKDEDLADNRFL